MICKNCVYGMLNELSDLVCTNDASEKCADFVYETDTCDFFVEDK